MRRVFLCVVQTGLSILIGAFLSGFALADDWPQWRGSHRDGVWRETGIVASLDGLQVQWRAPVSSGYRGPTVANGRVYVTDRMGKPKQIEQVHCFD